MGLKLESVVELPYLYHGGLMYIKSLNILNILKDKNVSKYRGMQM